MGNKYTNMHINEIADGYIIKRLPTERKELPYSGGKQKKKEQGILNMYENESNMQDHHGDERGKEEEGGGTGDNKVRVSLIPRRVNIS